MSYFMTLRSVRVKSKFKKKGNLDYLDWSQAWQLTKMIYPDSNYEILKPKDPQTGIELERSFFTDGKTGEVRIIMTIQDIPHEVILPIMDNRNYSIPLEKITSRDVNDTRMRALVKGLGMHGLGLNAWTGEKDFITEDEFNEILDSNDVISAREVLQYCELSNDQSQKLISKFKK